MSPASSGNTTSAGTPGSMVRHTLSMISPILAAKASRLKYASSSSFICTATSWIQGCSGTPPLLPSPHAPCGGGACRPAKEVPSSARAIPQEKEAGTAQGVLYASAYLGISLVTYVVGSWITYFYTPPVDSGLVARLSPTLVGIAVALGRIVDAVADPLVGAASDRLQSPRGRRLPFMRGSVIPLAAVFALLWTPPAFLGEAGAFLYLSVSLSLFFILYTLYVAPYLALLPELATRRDQRIAWSGWQGLFNIAGTALGGLGAGLLIEAAGFAAMGGVLALVAFASLALPAWLLREREGARGEAPPPSLVESVRLTMANPAFRPYVAGQFFFWLALYVMIAAIPYLATVVMGGSEADATVALGLALAVALLALAPLSALSRAVGLKKALNLAMGWFAAVLLLAGGIGRLPLPLSPYAQGLLVFALAGVPLAALFVFPNALLAEVTDIDFQRTGSRREAVYFGVQGFIVKLAVGLSALVTTGIIDALGYSREAPWGVLALGPVEPRCWWRRASPVSGGIPPGRRSGGRPAALPAWPGSERASVEVVRIGGRSSSCPPSRETTSPRGHTSSAGKLKVPSIRCTFPATKSRLSPRITAFFRS